MAAGDIVKVRTRGRLLGSNVEFGVHIRYNTTSATAADLAASWAATVIPMVKAASVSDCNWDRLTVSDTDPNGAESYDLPLTQPNPGDILGDPLPPQDAAVISLRTGVKGGRRRGRFYFPGITETTNQDGRMQGTQLTAIQALANGLINAYGPSGTENDYRLVVYSPEVLTFKPPRTPKPRPGTIITNVTSYTVDPVIRTQRRRSIGVGA
jgi:hypothetical protein